MAHEVFISYRRADTSGHAGRIGDDLDRLFGRPVAFRDVDSIAAGSDFVDALEGAIAAARVCIVLIGDTWLTETQADGTPRLADADDHVRREIELALSDEALRVVPVLVEGARMPAAADLPAPLQRLARLHAVELSESRWDFDLRRLADVLRAAGVAMPATTRRPRWLWPLLATLLAALVAVVAICCWRTAPTADDFAGLWYLPNGSYWSVREQGSGLWIEETHYDSRQVWKRGEAAVDGVELQVALALVFEQRPFRYLHRLRLSADRQSLIGEVRRSDRDAVQSVVLTRVPQ